MAPVTYGTQVPEQKNITNNNLVLTSADLLKMIKDKRER